MDWILEHEELIIAVIPLLIAVISAIVSLISAIAESDKSLKELAYKLMLEAEKMADEAILNSGAEKMDYVLTQLYENMPARVKAYVRLAAAISGKDVDTFLQALAQKLYEAMKKIVEINVTDMAMRMELPE